MVFLHKARYVIDNQITYQNNIYSRLITLCSSKRKVKSCTHIVRKAEGKIWSNAICTRDRLTGMWQAIKERMLEVILNFD